MAFSAYASDHGFGMDYMKVNIDDVLANSQELNCESDPRSAARCPVTQRVDVTKPLDDGILRTMWMTRDEMAACRERHRSPLVLQCVDEYLSGKRAPLELLHTHGSVFSL